MCKEIIFWQWTICSLEQWKKADRGRDSRPKAGGRPASSVDEVSRIEDEVEVVMQRAVGCGSAG